LFIDFSETSETLGSGITNRACPAKGRAFLRVEVLSCLPAGAEGTKLNHSRRFIEKVLLTGIEDDFGVTHLKASVKGNTIP